MASRVFWNWGGVNGGSDAVPARQVGMADSKSEIAQGPIFRSYPILESEGKSNFAVVGNSWKDERVFDENSFVKMDSYRYQREFLGGLKAHHGCPSWVLPGEMSP